MHRMFLAAAFAAAVSQSHVINATILFGPDGGDTCVIWRAGPTRYQLPGGGVCTKTGAGV